MDAELLEIPVEIRRILLDLTFSCLQAGPVDYVEHGCKYFAALIQRRQDMLDLCSNLDLRESLKLDMGILTNRRGYVFAEGFNPKEDMESVKIVIPKTNEERARLSAVIKDVLIFRDLDLNELDYIMDAMDQRFVKRDEIVILQGSVQADHFYVVNDGIFEAIVSAAKGSTAVVRTYENCGSFGELALMYNGPRAATVRAVTDGKLWVLDRATFRRIVLSSSYQRRERYLSLIDNVDFLKTLTDYEKFDLADSFLSKSYSDGEEIFHQGDTADGMYFIESGGVKCTMDHPVLGQVNIQVLEPGGYLGELALLTSMKRALSAYADGNTKLAFLDKETFRRLLGSCVEFLSRNFENYKEVLLKIMKSNNTDIDYADIEL